MDAEIPQLGPGTEPADCPVRGTAHRTPVKNRDGSDQRHLPSPPYSIGIYIIAKNPSLIPEARCGHLPREW